MNCLRILLSIVGPVGAVAMSILLTYALPVQASLSCRRVFYKYDESFQEKYFENTTLRRSRFQFSKMTKNHVLSGELSFRLQDGKVGLHGGMHTEYAFHRLLDQRRDLTLFYDQNDHYIRSSANGVQWVVVPFAAYENPKNIRGIKIKFNGKSLRGGLKGLFPTEWSAQDIMSATDAILVQYLKLRPEFRHMMELSYQSRDGTKRIRGVYNGVSVDITFNERRSLVFTVYPSSQQPDLRGQTTEN